MGKKHSRNSGNNHSGNYVGSPEDAYRPQDFARLCIWLASEMAFADPEVQGFARIIDSRDWNTHPDAHQHPETIDALNDAHQYYEERADGIPNQELRDSWISDRMREVYLMYATLDIARQIYMPPNPTQH